MEIDTNSKSSKCCIITRKIRLFIDIPNENKDELNAAFRKLYDWQKIAFKASNIIATHLYCQEQIREFEYFKDNIKSQLADFNKNENGLLNTSRQNTTYRLISTKFKSAIPAAIITSINQNVYANFVKERNEYFHGIRSLRIYKNTLPVPFTSASMYDFRYDEAIKNFKFLLFKDKKYSIPFKTYLGKDSSNNKVIIERYLANGYKICDSSYLIKDGKIYLLLTLRIPLQENVVNPKIEVKAKLSFLAPVIAVFKDKDYLIGNKESFVYKRVAIQNGLKRRQISMKYNKGGKGRINKTRGVEEFKNKEKNFINSYTHFISSDLIKFCLEKKAGKLILEDFKTLKDEALENPLILRNWSYGDLLNKINYKCKINNIEVVQN